MSDIAAQLAVLEVVAPGPDGLAARIDAHADRLQAAGDVAGLVAFSAALVAFSQEMRGAPKEPR